MKTGRRAAIWAAGIMTLLSGCGENATQKKAGELLKEAQTQFDNGRYTQALSTIDSLRKNCPEAIEARKAALRLYQEIELKRAQTNVETADKALQQTESEYENMKKTVEDLKKKGTATAEQLTSLTRMRLKRDSLKTVFDVECAKIKYINKKMKE